LDSKPAILAHEEQKTQQSHLNTRPQQVLASTSDESAKKGRKRHCSEPKDPKESDLERWKNTSHGKMHHRVKHSQNLFDPTLTIDQQTLSREICPDL